MFDFVKNIDYTLIRIITDVENNIKIKGSRSCFAGFIFFLIYLVSEIYLLYKNVYFVY